MKRFVIDPVGPSHDGKGNGKRDHRLNRGGRLLGLGVIVLGFVFALLPAQAASSDVQSSGGEMARELVPAPRIIGGVESKAGAYPWMVALVRNGTINDFQGQFCAGTLVKSDWVLTAGHCVTDDLGNKVPANTLVALVGRDDLLSTGGERLAVRRIVLHPDFEPWPDLASDVALLELEHPSSAEPLVVIGQIYGTPVLQGGETVTALGWGKTETGFPTALREVDLPIASNVACQNRVNLLSLVGGIDYFDVTEGMLCSLDSPGKDTCEGDSGGPLLVKLAGRWAQVGITSFGPGCSKPGIFGVYTRVSAFSDWISLVTCGPFDLPPDPVVDVATSGRIVTVSATEEPDVDGYRLYYAPYPNAPFIQHVDLGSQRSLTVQLPSGSAFWVAFRTYRESCVSPFSVPEYFVIP